MMRLAWSSLLSLALAATVAFGQSAHTSVAAQVQYSITGTLVSSADGSPVLHGHLRADLVDTGTRQASLQNTFDADEQGRFAIRLPSAGMWNLTAWGRGFVRNGYLGHEQFSSGVVLTREHPSMDIRFALAPEAVIQGVVTDEAGEAVREAQVSLVRAHRATPEGAAQASPQFSARTDDRGMYEFDGLSPGDYLVSVTAHPWYAVAAALGQHSDSDPPLDPALDMAYPVTWFPGVDNRDAAETLLLKGGDVHEADFHLRPVPALHLIIDPPADSAGNRNVRYFPIVQRMGSMMDRFQRNEVRTNAQGQIDVGGLTPGLYQVQLLGPGAPNLRQVVRVTGDGAQTVSFGDGTSEADVTVEFDGVSDDTANSLAVSLLDLDGRAIATTTRERVGFGRSGVRPAAPVTTDDSSGKRKQQVRTLNVPPGNYEVVLRSGMESADLYLAGITAKGAQATGRQVALPAGASTLTLHVVEGRAALTGFVTRDGKPSVGTLMMLVPATLGEPGALQIVRRDESNTDGSFNITDVIPGQYILIAIEDGWGINWKDKATLVRYLDGGIAVNLAARSRVAQDITAQRP